MPQPANAKQKNSGIFFSCIAITQSFPPVIPSILRLLFHLKTPDLITMANPNQERYDNVLFSLAQEHPGGALEFIDTVFSFFARKTDFFVGGGEGAAKKIILEKFDKWSAVAIKIKEAETKERAEAEKKRLERIAAKKREEEERIKQMAEEPQIMEISDEEAARFAEEQKKEKEGMFLTVL